MKKAGKNLKKIALYGMLLKIPLMIYLIISMATVPAIESVNYNLIPGAHRGEWGEYTENTIEAIKYAVESPEYQFIEFDIQYTKDKKIVVFHDSTLVRTQKKLANIHKITYAELLEISEYYIPSYEEIIKIIGDKKKINIEIKSSGDEELDRELVDYIIKDCKERGILNNVMISAISREVVEYVSETYPEIKTGQIFLITYSTYLHYNFTTKNLYEEIEETGADYVMLHGLNIKNIEKLIDLKPADKTLMFWYLNKEIYIVCKDKSDCLW